MPAFRTFILLWTLVCLLTPVSLRAQPPLVTVFEYIDTYSELSVEQMVEYRIPASVTLAQAIFESGSGTSALARKSNNHFGIKCHSQWQGDTAVKTDDTSDECFRKYSSIRDSYVDHSVFLQSRSRYARLFTIPVSDYRLWCQGLKETGYATFPGYAEALINIIERYRLYELDRTEPMKSLPFRPVEPEIKMHSANAQELPLTAFARHGLLWLNETEIHIRSLDMVLESATEEDFLFAGK